MFFPDKRKSGASVIVSKMTDGGSSPGVEMKQESDESEDSYLHSVAEDLIHAVKSGSASDVVSSLKAFISLADEDSDEG